MTARSFKKVYVNLAMASWTSIGFFAALPVRDLIEYAEIIKEATEKDGE
jgi:hypothetical protein